MALTETLHSVVDILGSSQGLIAMAIAAIVGIGSPVMDRLVIRRKRIQYQVLFNSKIGLSPVLVDDDGADEGTHKQAHPDLTGLVQQLDKLSVLMIRIRNVGSSDIEGADISPPLKVTFGSRVVWDARISEASDPMLRKQVREKLEFFPNGVETPGKPAQAAPAERRNLRTLRRLLGGRLESALTEPAEPRGGTNPKSSGAVCSWTTCGCAASRASSWSWCCMRRTTRPPRSARSTRSAAGTATAARSSSASRSAGSAGRS
ncbi:MAG TPA: hypothetical protein VGJ45_02735 [Pseudonocardiaceae bacterium]